MNTTRSLWLVKGKEDRLTTNLKGLYDLSSSFQQLSLLQFVFFKDLDKADVSRSRDIHRH